jgi:enoyl-CoA hydratase/carnithine racemase
VALAKAEELANNPTPVVMLIKELMARNPIEPDIEAVMEREQVRDRLARTWPDHAEAVRAFAEKREPRFNQPHQPVDAR